MRVLACLALVATGMTVARATLAIVGPPLPPPTHAAEPNASRGGPPLVAPRKDSADDERLRERWLVSVEGVVHAPSDAGFQAGVEFPFRMRVFTGFGIIPADQITNFVSGATNDSRAKLVLELPSYSGTIWRAKLGVRPFKKLGLYLDGGYARATIHGELDLSGTPFEEEAGGGGYRVRSALDLWQVELGYQWQIAHRGLIGIGGGVMSTFNASTSVRATGGAPSSSQLTDGAERANRAFESHGTIPMLTLRVGVDLL